MQLKSLAAENKWVACLLAVTVLFWTILGLTVVIYQGLTVDSPADIYLLSLYAWFCLVSVVLMWLVSVLSLWYSGVLVLVFGVAKHCGPVNTKDPIESSCQFVVSTLFPWESQYVEVRPIPTGATMLPFVVAKCCGPVGDGSSP